MKRQIRFTPLLTVFGLGLGLTTLAAPAFAQGQVCSEHIRALSAWEPCGTWCPGEAGMQLFQCFKPQGTMMTVVDGYLVRRASGSHYVISRGTGQRETGDYIHACDALLARCQ